MVIIGDESQVYSYNSETKAPVFTLEGPNLSKIEESMNE